MKRKYFIYLSCVLVLCIFLLIGWLGSLQIQVTNYTISNAAVPNSFHGFRIAQISDLHNRKFGKGNAELLSLLEAACPDIIVVTGDLIDSYRTNVDISAEFMELASKIAPCYYICGNHELRMPAAYSALKKRMTACGVEVLEDSCIPLTRDNESILLCGFIDRRNLSASQVKHLTEATDYTIVLSHRPEHFSVYQDIGADLVFSGHAHGGQIRLPWSGAIFAPGQGFFPKYAEGLHRARNTTMVVSRGLGNSGLPFRLYCPPELVVVQLNHE